MLKELGQTSKLMKNFLFSAHPSVKRIRRNIETNEKFSFQQLTGDLVLKIILNLDSFKATPVGDILADNFMIDTLQNLWTSFRKNFYIQHCLCILEMWKDTLDKGYYVCTMFMDLSKALKDNKP